MNDKSGPRADLLIAIAEVLQQSDTAILVGVKGGRPVCACAPQDMTDEVVMRVASYLLDAAVEGTFRKLQEKFNG
jgi:hypothetical protein